MGRLDQKVAVITGAARGLGKEIALTFSREGACIVVGDVIGMEEVVSEIEKSGGRAVAVKVDVSKKAEVKNLIDAAITNFKKVDILVNNAGISLRAPLMEMTEDIWDKVFDVNHKGVLLCTQAAAAHMIAQRYGKIVNIASIAGIGSAPSLKIAPNYAASKAGVVRLTRICAQELGPHGINVNAIAPGLILTEITHLGRSQEEAQRFIDENVKMSLLKRPGIPKDIANVALFLASEESSFITGQVIIADGGY
ncbi:MAG: 3-oxoacyl-ACP reductase FabG [Desulfobacterales bacterium]|nr:3-oxoacyl-ACP reductase FabG [Desulfobacterales bacterium]